MQMGAPAPRPVRERGVAKRPRRNATFPPHDPRAIKAALRRDLYQVGDSLRQLDDIEFDVRGEGASQTVQPLVNGVDLTALLHHSPMWAGALSLHYRGLTDADGQRRVSWTAGPRPGDECCASQLHIGVAGRYIRWVLPEDFDQREFIFDRSLYRERLSASLEDYLRNEEPFRRALREFYQRTPWQGPESMGLTSPWVCQRRDRRGVLFQDRFWRTTAWLDVGRFDVPYEEIMRRAVPIIARWDTSEMTVEWSGSVRPPHYPDHWVENPRTNPS